MAYLRKQVETYGVSEDVLEETWSKLSLRSRGFIFDIMADADDLEERDNVIDTGLDYLSERCGWKTLQGVVKYLCIMQK